MFKHLKNDLPASIVVFFVALPLCLGIALASGAPLFSAGLAAIVLTAIGTLGSYENFLVAVVLAGIIQLIFGVLKAGVIGYYFPSSVIKGMLTGIGIIIILKQIPHFFGYDAEPEGADSFIEASGENTFSSLFHIFDHLILGSFVIGCYSFLGYYFI